MSAGFAVAEGADRAMRLWFRVVVSLLCVALLAVSFWFHFADARASRERVEHEAVLMARALSRHAADLTSLIDMLQFDMVQSATQLMRGEADVASSERTWRDRLLRLSAVESICAFDRTGQLVLASGKECTRAPQLEWFHPFPALATKVDQIGIPFQSRGGGDWLIPAIETWQDDAGQPMGLVVLALRSSYLSSVYNNYDMTGRSGIALYRADGVLLARFPQVSDRIGRNFANSDAFRPALSLPSGSNSGPSPIDGVDRIRAFERVPNAALTVVVALDVGVLPGWGATTLASFGALALLIGCVVMVSRQLDRHLASNFDTREKMTLQARTDVLTGLPNRRAFDEAMAREWASAAQNGTSLSMLLFDVDQFKAFNDTYGHLAGDGCLRRVAGTLQQGTFETIGHLARFGGEEFALLLIDVTPGVAVLVAEHLRANIQGLQMRHAGNKGGGVVTVSIGIATQDLGDAPSDMAPAELIARADKALYRAKNAGRNRVEQFQAKGDEVVALRA
ncbi:GGDEF domain-containing protein [Aureimonas sp. AU4]|uniref:sensor domain-containing diguanylate cyclase n=1 Tax=Aureimonas sp. AU4 TaxID=1638163 RepID=UPI0009EC0CBB|nr:GGDEF domain-containing protein [Aureimonas sp. AU4]